LDCNGQPTNLAEQIWPKKSGQQTLAEDFEPKNSALKTGTMND